MEAVPAPLGSPWTHAENGGVRRYGIACGLLMLTSRYAGRTTLSWPSSLVNPECTREGREAGNCGDTERNTIACKGVHGRAVDDLPGPEDIEHHTHYCGHDGSPEVADAVYCPAHRSAHLVGVSLTPDGERE